MIVRLEKQLRFETLISDLSAEFVRLSYEEVDGGIEHALKRILDFFQCDRCGLLGMSEDREVVFLGHACYAEGTEHVAGDVNLAALFPWAYEQLVGQGKPVRTVELQDLPPEAEQDRQSWTEMGVRSSLDIPLFSKEEVRYIIVIQSLSEVRDWPEEYIPRLRLLGEVFVNALERKKADEALRESEARLRLATDSAEAGLWVMDVDSGYIWVTQRTRALYHLDQEEEVTYQSFLDIVHPDDRQMVRDAVQDSIDSGSDLRLEYRIVLPDGSIRWISARGRCETIAPDKPARLMGASVDITERKQAEGALRDLSGQLINAAEKERAHIARDLHDDFNQRLALLAVELDLLGQGPQESFEATQQQLAALSSSVRALSNDIQHLSHQLHPAKLEQLGLVTALQSLCREISTGSSMQVEFSAGDVPRSLPDELGLCLYRIAQEALQNVVKHSGADHASVEVSSGPGEICLTVTDSGRGFGPESEDTAKGLGLVSMQERVRLVGGELCVDSAPARGTRVEVRVPFSQEDRQ